ncbi:MAG: metallophosphoesterase, partial [Calditrichia bacterium]
TNQIKFLLYGDIRSNPDLHDQVAAAMLPTLAGVYQSLVINTGDMVKNGNNESQWDDWVFNPIYTNIRALMANVPYVANMGNHDAYATGAKFRKYLPYPYVERSNWSFEYGPAFFLILDQYIDYSPGSTQYAWMESQLASTTKQWKFISLHAPGWSAGAHDNDSTVQAVIQPLAEQYGVSMVFCGHNHYYARAEVNGVQHITTGGGGAQLYDPDPSMPNVVTAIKARHFCKVRIDGNALTLVAIQLDGTVIDSFTIQAPVVSIQDDSGDHFPTELRLEPAYPNPFNPSTTISYHLPKMLDVLLKIYNIFGQEIVTLVKGREAAGQKSVVWDGRDQSGQPVSSGVYIYRLVAADPLTDAGRKYSHSRTMVLMK